MKKFSIVLLALLLCASMLFTGCVNPEMPEEDDENKKNPPVQTQEVNKDTVIQDFNKIDLYAMYKAIERGVDEIAETEAFDVHAMEQQINGELTMGENSLSALVTFKDGVLHAKLNDTTSGAVGSEEIYMYITEAFEVITFELGEDGKWVPAETGDVITPLDPVYPSETYVMTSDEDSEGLLSELLGFDAEILKRITIPKIAENQLTEKDGKLVLSNEYFGDLIVANYDLLLELLGAEGAPTKEELRTELVDGLNTAGLEVAFTANKQAITGVYVTLAPEETETVISLAVELNDTAKALERIKAEVKVGTEYGYDSGVSVELTTTLDGNDITAAKLAVEVNAATEDYVSYEDIDNGYIYKYIAVCGTYKFEANLSGIDSGNEIKLDATLTSNVDKVFEVSEVYSSETYEPTVTFEEIDTEGYGTKIDAELSIVLNRLTQKCDVNFELIVDDMTIAANGTWYFTIAPDAGKVPAEITEYINSLK